MSFPFIVVQGTITATVNNKTYIINRDHLNYDRLYEILKTTRDPNEFVRLADVKRQINIASQGKVSVSSDGETVYYENEVCHGLIAVRIIEMIKEGLPVEHYMKFLDKLMNNPSAHSIDALYTFMERGNLPITPEGNVLGYKAVRGDYKDFHSGTFDNTPGSRDPKLPIPRRKVDDNPTVVCSDGIHIGTLGYASGFNVGSAHGHRIVICEFDPADVVSVPIEASADKIRVCDYRPIADYTGDLHPVYETRYVEQDEEEYEDDDYEDYDDEDDEDY